MFRICKRNGIEVYIGGETSHTPVKYFFLSLEVNRLSGVDAKKNK